MAQDSSARYYQNKEKTQKKILRKILKSFRRKNSMGGNNTKISLKMKKTKTICV